jgi:hypothetical protein
MNVVLNDQLNGYDNGFGSDPTLSGQVWIRYAVRARESAGPRRQLAGPRRLRAHNEAG